MCVCWPRVCVASHVICSTAYVCTGAVQLIAGIFFLISLPVFKIGSNLWTGSWNVLVGVGGAVFSCVGDLTAVKHQILLYLTLSVIIVNSVNLVILELGEWRILMPDAVKKVIQQKHLNTLVFYARTTTSISSLVAVVTSFFDAQFMFCWIEKSLRPRTPLNQNETVSDIEYIIPRVKSGSMGKHNSNNIYNQYAQSWVFDTDTVGSSQSDSPHSKLPHFSGSKTVVLKQKQQHHEHNSVTVQPVVLVEDMSNSGRHLQFMTSFSRTPSPAGMSDTSSEGSNPPPIYECLEKLTEPSVYRSRLNTAIGTSTNQPQPNIPPRPHSIVVSDQVQYASLMLELEKTIVAKFPSVKSPSNSSPATRLSSRRTSSRDIYQKNPTTDAEFSKELEAALQLIQDLESPNTAETPTEGPIQQNLSEDNKSGGNEFTEAVNFSGKDCKIAHVENRTIISLGPQKKYMSVVHIEPADYKYNDCQNKIVTNDIKYFINNILDPNDMHVDNSVKTGSENINLIKPFELPKSDLVIKSSTSATPHHLQSESPLCINKEAVNDDVYQRNQDAVVDYEVKFNATATNNNNYLHYNTIYRKPECFETTDDTRKLCWTNELLNTLRTSRLSLKTLLKKRKPYYLHPEVENSILKSESLAHLTEPELIAWYNKNKLMHRVRKKNVHIKMYGRKLHSGGG